MAASVSDNLKMSNSNTAKCFSAVETLATRSAAVASPIDAWLNGTPCLRSPLRWSRPRHRRLHQFLILSRQHLWRPRVRHPVHPVVVVSFLSPPTHPATASTIRTHVRNHGGRGGVEEHHEHPHHQEPTSWRGTAGKQKEPAIPEWKAVPKSEEYPSEPTAHGPVRKGTPLRGGTSIPSRKMFSLPPGTFVHALSSYGHVYSLSSESCTKCKWRCPYNHGPPRLQPVPNAYGAKKLHQSGGG